MCIEKCLHFKRKCRHHPHSILDILPVYLTRGISIAGGLLFRTSPFLRWEKLRCTQQAKAHNYEKHAPRVSQVIAAVAKVSCKHGLWLVARVNKTGNSMAVFLITTELPVLFVLFYFYFYFFLFLFFPAVRKKYLQFICSNRFGIIVSLKPGSSHSPEIIF